MPQVITHTRTLYRYHELSDKAKEAARDWYTTDLPNEFWGQDTVYEEAVEIARLMGITIDTKTYKTESGRQRVEPAIYWSGFWSQGDGACFEGRYSGVPQAFTSILSYASKDLELQRIASELDDLQEKCPGNLSATVKQSGHYQHSGCTDIDVEIDTEDDDYLAKEFGPIEKRLCRALRDFMDWIYAQLEQAYDYATSEEAIAETMEANGYTFDVNGKRLDADAL